MLDDFSGQFCTGNCMGPVNAVRIAADEFGNKIDGVPIEIIWGDHQNKPDVGVALTNKWLDTEQVDVIVDVVNSSVALAVQNIARTKGKAVLYSTAGSSDLTGKQCAPYSAHWSYDTYQFGKTIGEAVPYLGKSWFIIATDFAYGKILAAQIKLNVEKAGGKVLGTVFHPFNINDASSFILQAQASGAQVIALANSGNDATNSVKAAKEFGLVDGGVKIVPVSMDLPFVEGAGGLPVMQGMFLPLPWYPGGQRQGARLLRRVQKAPRHRGALSHGRALFGGAHLSPRRRRRPRPTTRSRSSNICGRTSSTTPSPATACCAPTAAWCTTSI